MPLLSASANPGVASWTADGDGLVLGSGGIARGTAAIDLQTTRSNPGWVALGDYSGLLWGRNSVIQGTCSGGGGDGVVTVGDFTLGMGRYALANGTYATAIGGNSPTASGTGATSIGGYGSAIGAYATAVGGTGVSATAAYATAVGGYSNQATYDYASVVGGAGNQATGPYASVFGGSDNVAGYGAAWPQLQTVVGGWRNYAYAGYSSIVGGQENSVQFGGYWQGIFSSRGSQIGDGASDTSYSVIIGGRGGGLGMWGYDTSASTIVGGRDGVVGQYYDSHYAAIVGGLRNRVDATYSAALGGYESIIDGSYGSAIVGGNRCEMHYANTAWSKYSAIVAGNVNVMDGVYHCSIVGGRANQIYTGYNSVIVGGQQNFINDTAGWSGSSVILGGRNNQLIDNTEGSVAIGRYALVDDEQYVLAFSAFATLGKAQTEIRPGGATTVGAVTAEILSIKVPTSGAHALRAVVSAYNTTDNSTSSWCGVIGLAQNVGGTTTLVGQAGNGTAAAVAAGGTGFNNDASAATIAVNWVADDPNDTIDLVVTGVAGKTLRWSATCTLSRAVSG